MVTIRRRRRCRRATKRLMGSGMHIVRRPRRQRGGRMHYMRCRFQKGKGLMNPRAKGVTSEDVRGFSLLALLAGASWVTDKVAHSKRKKI